MLAILVSLLLTLPSLSADGSPRPELCIIRSGKSSWEHYCDLLVFVAAHIGGDTRGCYLLVAAVQLQPAMDPAVGHPGLL